ncbi:MAG: glucokinase [Gammaproteobacteria bacterium]
MEVDTNRWLLADIGGTNARFALYARDDAPRQVQATACASHPSIEAAIGAYLARHAPGVSLAGAAIAVAAPVNEDRVVLTNRDWSFSIAALRSALGVRRLTVVNDFQAAALSIPRLDDAALAAIGPDLPRRAGVAAAIGPGTGLGMAGLVRSAGGWVAVPGEGGHATLAAQDEREWRVLSRLQARYGHVSTERVVSGPGLVELYAAIDAPSAPDPALDSPAAVAAAADAGDPRAVAARAMFFDLLGTAAGNLALTLGARGGVYLFGGILPRMASALRNSGFRGRFEAKGRFRDYLAGIGTWLVTAPHPTFLGLAQCTEDVH